MKVIIAGTRTVQPSIALELIESAIEGSGWRGEISEVIHGGAMGIDTAAGEYAKDKWPVTVVPANWKEHGKAAGPIRNLAMAKMADALIAIWDGQSIGTRDMINKAKSKGLRIYVHNYHVRDK